MVNIRPTLSSLALDKTQPARATHVMFILFDGFFNLNFLKNRVRQPSENHVKRMRPTFVETPTSAIVFSFFFLTLTYRVTQPFNHGSGAQMNHDPLLLRSCTLHCVILSLPMFMALTSCSEYNAFRTLQLSRALEMSILIPSSWIPCDNKSPRHRASSAGAMNDERVRCTRRVRMVTHEFTRNVDKTESASKANGLSNYKKQFTSVCLRTLHSTRLPSYSGAAIFHWLI